MTQIALVALDLLAIGALLTLYFLRHRRRDLVVAFLVINVGVLAVAAVLADAAVGIGFGLGLFGVLSIIRLRSSEIAQREVAYYFAALTLGLVAGFPAAEPWQNAALMALVVGAVGIGDLRGLLSNYRQQVIVLAALGTRPRILEIEGARSIRYDSVYFDTPALDSFHSTVHARRRRFKIRTRRYGTGGCYLEVKTRGRRGNTVKERTPLAVERFGQLGQEDRRYVRSVLDRVGRGQLAERLQPIIASRYRRATLLLPGTGARATIDTELLWEHADGSTVQNPDLVIIETKSSAQPSGLDRLLWAHGLRPGRLSKFGTGLAAAHPELPSNRWNRVLQRHFTAVSPRSPLSFEGAAS